MKTNTLTTLLVLAALPGCAIRGQLFGTSPSTSTSATPSPVATSSSPSPAPTSASPVPANNGGQLQYFLADIDRLDKRCPLGPKPPNPQNDEWYNVCHSDAQEDEFRHLSADDQQQPAAQKASKYLAKHRDQVKQWGANIESNQKKSMDDYETREAIQQGQQNNSAVYRLKQARDGNVTPLASGDLGNLGMELKLVTDGMPALAKVAENCDKANSKDDGCDIAKNRDAYYQKMLAMQWDAIVAEKFEYFGRTIEQMKKTGFVFSSNYDQISDIGKQKKIAAELVDAGKVLGRTNVGADIDKKLGALKGELAAAVKSKMSGNPLAQYATDAKYTADPAAMKALHNMPGYSPVKVVATQPTWEVIRGDFDQPVSRNQQVWILVKKAGDGFCRLYPATILEDHLGGGKYGAPRVDIGDDPQFYVSRCN